MNHRLSRLLILSVCAAGCPEVLPNPSSQASGLGEAECPSYGDTIVARACYVDATGNTYRQGDTLNVLTVTPPYTARLQFGNGYLPLNADLTTEGPSAAIQAFAANYDVSARQGHVTAEDYQTNRIPVQATLSPDGFLSLVIADPIPSGYQVSITLDFGGLFRGRMTAASDGGCDLPDRQQCAYLANTGFVFRFYVGTLPASFPGTKTPPDAGAGACLLEYNSALASGDPCCYQVALTSAIRRSRATPDPVRDAA